MVTIAVALVTRGSTLSLNAMGALAVDLLALVGGGVVAAFFGAGWASRFSEARLRQVILVLLVTIGGALILEAFLPGDVPGLLPANQLVRAAARATLRPGHRLDQQHARCRGRRGHSFRR